MRFFQSFLLWSIISCFIGETVYAKDIELQHLTCNYQVNPLGIDDKPILGWQIYSEQKGVMQKAYRILIASSLQKLNANEGDIWDTKKVITDQSQNIRYNGQSLAAGKYYYWKVMIWDEKNKPVAWSAPAYWRTGLLSKADWQGEWISNKFAPVSTERKWFRNWKERGKYQTADTAAIYMRKTFTIQKKIRQALVFISGLGYYELYINGKKTGDRVMDPVFTDYQRRVSYITYNVTGALQKGNNALGIILGNGFYNSPSEDLFQFEKAHWKTPPKLLLNLHIEYTDGSKSTVVTDGSWKWNTGEITYNSTRGGETIDHRQQQFNWHTAGFNGPAWKKAVVVPAPIGKLTVQYMPPMKVNEIISPVAIQEPKQGVYVIDFGKNITGWISLKTSGASGQVINCYYNEVLNKDGTLNTRYSSGHTGGRFQKEIFILNGNKQEQFEPRFTYHGFRYVQLEGLNDKPSLKDIQAKSVHTALDTTGNFVCSSTHMNQLQLAVQRTLLNSIHGIPGEEPTREKMGWTLDAAVTMESYLYNFDAINTYKKSLQDFIDAQEPNGHIPSIVPTNGWAFLDSAGNVDPFDDPWWAGSIFFIAEKLFEHTGDTAIIAHAFDAMKAYVDYVATTAKDDFVYWSLGDWLDMAFVTAPGLTPVVQTSTAAYYWMNDKLARFAKILNKNDVSDVYAKNAGRIKEKFNSKFLNEATGWYRDSSQTAQVLPLYLGMVPHSIQDKVEDKLLQAIAYTGNHVSVGFVGVLPFLNYLPEAGYMDKSYEVFKQADSPGWLHMVKDSNSTLGENLNSKGYGTGHHPYGAHIGSWLFKYLGGIRSDSSYPGFKRFIIEPHIPSDLDSCSVKTHSLYGEIKLVWRKNKDRLQVEVLIPANTMARVLLPANNDALITADGKQITHAAGITLMSREKNKTVLNLLSGYYKLEMPLR